MRVFRGSSLFSFMAVDESGVEIRLSAFDGLAEKFASLVYPGKVCYSLCSL